MGYGLWRFAFRKIGICIGLFSLPLLLMQVSVLNDFYGGKNEAHYYQKAKILLTDDFSYFQEKGTDWERGVMATAWFAETLVLYAQIRPEKKEEIGLLLKNACEILLSKKINTCQADIKTCHEGLYLAQTLNTLIAYRHHSKTKTYDSLSLAFATRLAELMAQESSLNAPSYGASPDRWTGDNALILSALAHADQSFGTQFSKPLVIKWKTKIETHYTDPKTGLLLSEIGNNYPWSAYPRGSSIGYTIRYLAQIEPTFSQTTWEKYKKHYKLDFFLISLFREYPTQIDFQADYDSGIDFYGIGAAATGNAITASSALSDEWTFWQLQNTLWGGYLVISLFPSYFESPDLGNEADWFMANALYFWAWANFMKE